MREPSRQAVPGGSGNFGHRDVNRQRVCGRTAAGADVARRHGLSKEVDLTRVYLHRNEGSWTSSGPLWTAALKYAVAHGWTPNGTRGTSYGADSSIAPRMGGELVYAQDARALAEALSRALGQFPDAPGSPILFRWWYRQALSSLADYCAGGEFTIL